ncbi:MAG: hypothetical protein ACM3ZE_30055, partial [Myxococcales bacterium]
MTSEAGHAPQAASERGARGVTLLAVVFQHFPLPRAARSASMALGESRPGVARSARPGGWGHH